MRRDAAGDRPPDAVAVEPLEASGEPDVRNLAGLVTAQLAATLGRAPGLRVILLPRSSSASAEALERVRVGVRWTLQGTVFLTGEDVAVTLTMTEAPAGRVAWTATAKGRFGQILSLASRMASEAGGAAGSAVAAGRLDFPDRETFEDFVRADRALSSYDPAQLDTAVTLFSRCVDRAPSFAPSYPRLGFSLLQYRNLGVDYDLAILDRAHAVIRKGLEIDPGNLQLVLALGWFRLYTYDFARAHEAVAQLAALPSGADLGCKLALWDEFYRGEPKAVTETLPAMSRPNPFDRSLDLNVVVLNAMLDRPEEALAVSREFEATEPYTVLPVLARGWLSLAEGRAADAARDVGESFRRRPDPIVGLLAAQAALVAGDPRASTDGLRAWLGKNPYSLEAHRLRCLAHELSGNEAEARAAAAGALRWADDRRAPRQPDDAALPALLRGPGRSRGRRPRRRLRGRPVRAGSPDGLPESGVALARLGRAEALDGIPTPTSPTSG